MLSISHALTGAFVASKLLHPGLYVPVALGLHYLEDWIPHWDVGTGLSNGKRTRRAAILLELVDLAVTVGLIYLFWGVSGVGVSWHIWLGAFVGLLPDFIEFPRNFFNYEPGFIKTLNKFHGKFHHSIPNVVKGLVPQILLIGAIWLLR